MCTLGALCALLCTAIGGAVGAAVFVSLAVLLLLLLLLLSPLLLTPRICADEALKQSLRAIRAVLMSAGGGERERVCVCECLR